MREISFGETPVKNGYGRNFLIPCFSNKFYEKE
jgi:ribosomal protein L9